MKMNDHQLQDQVPKQHGIEFMSLPKFAIAQRAVEQYIQTEVLQKDI